MNHYPDQYEKFSSEVEPLCSICRDSDKESLSKVKGEGWVCDDCSADLEHYDKHCEEYEERKRKRLFDAQEH